MTSPCIQKQLIRHALGTEAEKLAIEDARQRLPEIEDRLRAIATSAKLLAETGQVRAARKAAKEAEALYERYVEYREKLS
jgi:two-component sensor histidine kinase